MRWSASLRNSGLASTLGSTSSHFLASLETIVGLVCLTGGEPLMAGWVSTLAGCFVECGCALGATDPDPPPGSLRELRRDAAFADRPVLSIFDWGMCSRLPSGIDIILPYIVSVGRCRVLGWASTPLWLGGFHPARVQCGLLTRVWMLPGIEFAQIRLGCFPHLQHSSCLLVGQ